MSSLADERHGRLAAAAPKDLAEKIRGASLTGERRPVTALFADIVGSTTLAESMDPEEWTVIVNEAFARMAEAVYRYEGTIAQLLGDGILAFFGAPVAHEDDPERAVRSALDILASVERYASELRGSHGIELSIRAGINTGPVVVGNVGGDLRYEYTAVGDAVNVAARVQAAARPGSILVTDGTYRFVAHAVDAVDLGTVELKGKSEPVHVHEIAGLAGRAGSGRGVPGLTSSMVGRAAELARLASAVEATRAGRGGCALVLGEPGLGKSRLLAELRGHARGVSWAEAHCPSYGRSIAYGLLLDLVSAVPAHPDRGDSAAAGDDAFLARLLGRELTPAQAERLAPLEPQALHAGYLAAVGRLLRSAAGSRPLVLVSEDLHWADQASVAALAELLAVADEVPLLLVCTARPDREAPGWELVARARDRLGDDLCEVVLDPLSPEHSRELVGQLLAIESLPRHLRRLILAKSEGNPLFLEEVIRTLIDEGAIAREGERWVATGEAAAVTIPPTLHGLLLARIDRLPEDPRRAVRVASVVGEEFEEALVREVLADELALEPALAAAVASGLVRLEHPGPRAGYAFRHALVRETAYESLLRQERRRLHAAVADALERRHGEDPEHAAVVALHLEQAGDHERALPHLVRAGRHALDHFAVREARDFLDRAAQQIPADDLRQRVEVGLARVTAGYTFVPADDELALMKELLAEAEALGDPALEGELHLWIAKTLRMKGEYGDTVTRSLDRARAIGDELDDDHFRALPLALEGAADHDAAEFRSAVTKLERAVALLEHDGSLADASYFTGVLALVRSQLGEFARADELLPRAAELARRSGDPNAILDADIFGGYVESARGNLEEGIELARRGVEAAEKVGNTLCAVVGSYALGEQYLRRGDLERAIPALERSTELAEYCDAGPVALLARAWLASVRARMGDPEGAIVSFEAALEEVRKLGNRFSEAEILAQRALARTLTPLPDWDAAAADFEDAIATFERVGARPNLARTLQEYGLALQSAGFAAEGEDKLRRAMELFEAMGIAAAAA